MEVLYVSISVFELLGHLGKIFASRERGKESFHALNALFEISLESIINVAAKFLDVFSKIFFHARKVRSILEYLTVFNLLGEFFLREFF